ncbi:MAG: hypothetical protein ACP5HJ_00045 [Candidatus Micrarchaeia archaeon]
MNEGTSDEKEKIVQEMTKLKNFLNSKRVEVKLYTNLLEKKKKEENIRPLRKLIRMKKNLEFRISVEARTKEEEKRLINEIAKIEEEIKKAREIKRIERKIMLIGKDIEETLAKIKELKKKISKPKEKNNNKEFRVEDIVTIKKKD